MIPRSLVRSARHSLVLVLAPLLVAGLAACGSTGTRTVADNEGVYVQAGKLAYQVQISRALNPYSVEDREYLAGVSAPPPNASEQWFGVFLWAKNQTETFQQTSNSFDIVDTQGHKYYPVPVNPQVNPFAWRAMWLRPLGTEPGPDSPAFFSPTQGGELLFKISDSAYSNRPLSLQIYAAGQTQPSTVSLDL